MLFHTLATYSHFPGSELLLGWISFCWTLIAQLHTYLLVRRQVRGNEVQLKARQGWRKGGRRFVRIKNTLAQMFGVYGEALTCCSCGIGWLVAEQAAPHLAQRSVSFCVCPARVTLPSSEVARHSVEVVKCCCCCCCPAFPLVRRTRHDSARHFIRALSRSSRGAEMTTGNESSRSCFLLRLPGA